MFYCINMNTWDSFRKPVGTILTVKCQLVIPQHIKPYNLKKRAIKKIDLHELIHHGFQPGLITDENTDFII